jgi:hypothetical protein
VVESFLAVFLTGLLLIRRESLKWLVTGILGTDEVLQASNVPEINFYLHACDAVLHLRHFCDHF